MTLLKSYGESRLKTIRYWLASKILGGLIVEEFSLAEEKMKWAKEQLNQGNSVTLEYKVTNIAEKRKQTK